MPTVTSTICAHLTAAGSHVAAPRCGARDRAGRLPPQRSPCPLGYLRVRRRPASVTVRAEDRGTANTIDSSPVAIELRSRLQQTQLARKKSGDYGWLDVEGSYVKLPAGNPEGVVHFVGGALLGSFPQIAYEEFLQRVCDYGSQVIVATPYDLDTDHQAVLQMCNRNFDAAITAVQSKYTGPLTQLPLWGMGHSLGAKVQALACCNPEGDFELGGLRRHGNILISFNNFSALDSVELVEGLAKSMLAGIPGMGDSMEIEMMFRAIRMASSQGMTEFSPDPEETKEMIRDRYCSPRTRVCKFKDDTIDQSETVEKLVLLSPRNTGGTVSRGDLEGNHLSPVFVNLQAPGEFAPQLQGLGLGSEVCLGELADVEALAMDVVSFLKGFL